jgi:hypothetical protein
MVKLVSRLTLGFVMCGTVIGLVGCEPAKDPMWSPPSSSNIASHSNWRLLEDTLEQSDGNEAYEVVYHAHWIHAGASHTVTGDAHVNQGQFLLSINTDSIGYDFYQMGQTAYVEKDGHWKTVTPLQNTDLFTAYRQVIGTAAANKLTLATLPRKFVGNEYCSVRQAVIPSSWLHSWSVLKSVASKSLQSKSLPSNLLPSNVDSSSVIMTFYIGQQSHRLRFVETVSTDAVQSLGASETATNIEFYFDAASKNIAVPTSLARQLGHSLNG